jgi:MFS family permease
MATGTTFCVPARRAVERSRYSFARPYLLISIALAVTTPLYVYFGHLSDRIGRKRIMLTGCLLAAVTYLPIFVALRHFSNPDGLSKADPAQIRYVPMVLLLVLQMVYGCMFYGPIAAFLVELFPTRVRYTSMSLPYHLGNGWFGGFLPLIATAVTTSTWAKSTFGAGAIYTGLLYPIAICLVTFVVGSRFIRETKSHKLDADQPEHNARERPTFEVPSKT